MEIGSYKKPPEFTLARIETICAMWDEMALPPRTTPTNGLVAGEKGGDGVEMHESWGEKGCQLFSFSFFLFLNDNKAIQECFSFEDCNS